MRRLIVTELMTLDGVVDSPGGGDHPRAGWSFNEVAFDPAAYEIKGREQQEAGAVLLGRRSYDEFAPVWPRMAEFEAYNAMPKHVVSSSLRDPGWANTSVLRSIGDVADLRQQDGDGSIIVHGSIDLAQQLLAADLVDRYHLLVFPLVLGTGRRLFAERDVLRRFDVAEHEVYGNGVVKLVYDVRR